MARTVATTASPVEIGCAAFDEVVDTSGENVTFKVLLRSMKNLEMTGRAKSRRGRWCSYGRPAHLIRSAFELPRRQG